MSPITTPLDVRKCWKFCAVYRCEGGDFLERSIWAANLEDANERARTLHPEPYTSLVVTLDEVGPFPQPHETL